MTVQRIVYCAIGCKKDGHRVTTDGRSQLCRRCETNLHDWLTKIPDLYATLPTFAIPGTVEKNPEAATTKRSEVAAPIRLDVLDLLDTRLGRIWNGIAPAHDRRGVLGTLLVHAERLTEERPLTTTNPRVDPTVAGLCELLDRHHLWIAEQDWIKEFHDELKDVHRACSNAAGLYRRPPVGHCHIETDTGTCDGPLYASTYGGVRCARCQATWDANHLRQLGLAQAATQDAG